MTRFRAAGLQMDIAWEDRKTNYAKVENFTARATDNGIDLLVLPEMFATGFSMNPAVTAEEPNGETVSFLRELSLRHGIAIVGGYVEKRPMGRGANIALVVDEKGEIISKYTKTHLFSHMREDEAHEAGDRPRPFAWHGGEMACFICFDLRFPELFRLVADEVSVFFVIASWPEQRQRHWDILVQARAVENQCYVVAVNRIGMGGGLSFEGGSVIADPSGQLLAKAGGEEGLVIAEIDCATVEKVRREMPFLRDRKFR